MHILIGEYQTGREHRPFSADGGRSNTGLSGGCRQDPKKEMLNPLNLSS